MAIRVPDIGLYRLSIPEYHQLIASGGLDEDARVELIDGLMLGMSPRSPAHENAIAWLIDWLVAQLDHTRYRHGVTRPLTIGNSEPEPDLSVIDRAPLTDEHPNRARLVIEVALTSQDRDLNVKPALYAAAVQEYWVVDLEREVIVIHREPSETGYARVTEVPAGEPATPAAVDLAAVDTAALFAAAAAGR